MFFQSKPKAVYVSEPQTQADRTYLDSVRPKGLSEFVGQDQIKDALNEVMESALIRHEPLDHTLIYGPAGLGKTTLANIIANTMGGKLHTTLGPAIETGADLMGIITKLNEGDFLFIDEIHRMKMTVEENLYPPMEDFEYSFTLGEGADAETCKVSLPRFTILGATTQRGMLSAPLRSRFQIDIGMDFYDTESLASIVERTAGLLNVRIEHDAAMLVGRVSRGTPRIANKIMKRIRDYVTVQQLPIVTLAVAETSLLRQGIDTFGLDDTDRKYLRVLYQNYKGGPAGVSTMAASIQEAGVTIEEAIEPFLMKEGLIIRSHSGRKLTEKGMELASVI